MKKAIVTGATSGIGYACAQSLINNGYEVVGIGRKNTAPSGVQLLQCDLLNEKELLSIGQKALELLGGNVNVLVNAAGVGFFAPHEELSYEKLKIMLHLNLLVPLELTRQLLRNLKTNTGHIINIASITAKKPSPQGAAYSATKAGILHFSEGLFEEARKSGIKTTSIVPDVTLTQFFDNNWFAPSSEQDAHLTAECIADAMMFAINFNGVLTEIVAKPQKVSIVNKKAKKT